MAKFRDRLGMRDPSQKRSATPGGPLAQDLQPCETAVGTHLKASVGVAMIVDSCSRESDASGNPHEQRTRLRPEALWVKTSKRVRLQLEHTLKRRSIAMIVDSCSHETGRFGESS